MSNIKHLNILIIDDHPMIVQGYINCLSDKTILGKSPKFSIAHNCKDAFKIINSAQGRTPFDIALIDQSLPVYEEENVFCGGDLALLLKKKNANCKIIMITFNSKIITVYNLIQRVCPHGFIIKCDINSENLVEVIQSILLGATYHSCSVKKLLQQLYNKELLLDDVNRKILLFLAKGYKIKEIEIQVSLSMSAIQRRISQMKDAFNLKEENNLVREALFQDFL
ncbi:MAG: hypothetical protein ACOH2V_14710 [Candidatus Saccharimonadaceae bacterium]